MSIINNEYGYCVAKRLTYFGFKLHLITDGGGVPIHFDLSPANVHDVEMAKELLTYESGGHLVLADKGYISRHLQDWLQVCADVELMTPTRANQKIRESKADRRLLNSWRQRIEVVNALLKEQFRLEKTLAKSLVGLVRRVMAKITALTFGIFLNTSFSTSSLADQRWTLPH